MRKGIWVSWGSRGRHFGLLETASKRRNRDASRTLDTADSGNKIPPTLLVGATIFSTSTRSSRGIRRLAISGLFAPCEVMTPRARRLGRGDSSCKEKSKPNRHASRQEAKSVVRVFQRSFSVFRPLQKCTSTQDPSRQRPSTRSTASPRRVKAASSAACVSNTLYVLKRCAHDRRRLRDARLPRGNPAGFALAPERHREPAGPPDRPPRSALDALQIRARRALVRVSTRPFATVLAFPVPASLIARGVAGERASLTLKP